MRTGRAFTIFPALVGNAVSASQLMQNPPELIFHAALETIGAAGSVFSAIAERRNTELLKEAAERNIIDKAQEYATALETQRMELESRLRREKKRLQDVRFRDKVTTELASMMKAELERVSKCLKDFISNLETLEDDNWAELDRLYEVLRKTTRDYHMITNIYSQGG